MQILLVSSMYPGPNDPDFGVFVEQIVIELEREGHAVDRAVVDERAGSIGKQLRLAKGAFARARRAPDIVYAHYLFPAGAVGALAARVARVPLVLTAHGRDVRNIGTIRGVGRATRFAVTRADTVIAVSDYLRRELVAKLPQVEGHVEVISSGVDLERFRGRDPNEARRQVGWGEEGPHLLFVGTLDERKNVVRLADAFDRLGHGNLVFIGDGPARSTLEGRPRVRVVGRLPHASVADWIAACDVLCQPSLIEPFGQALLEAMASERSVVATRVGGPPEFVTSDAGALVEPASVDSIATGLEHALALPRPNSAARAEAAKHDVRTQAKRVEAVLERAIAAVGARAQ